MAQHQMQTGISLAGAVDLSGLQHKISDEQATQMVEQTSGGYVIDVNEQSFQSVLQNSATFPIILLLWVDNDERVITMAQRLGSMVNNLQGDVQLARVNVQQCPNIAQMLQTQAIPVLYGIIAGRPMMLLQGLPMEDDMEQIETTLLPKIVEIARQSGVQGKAPFVGNQLEEENAQRDSTSDVSGVYANDELTDSQVPPEHVKAYNLAKNGDFAQAAAAYEEIITANPQDLLALREHAKALLLSRSAALNVRLTRVNAADNPDDLQAQLSVADIDMIGGQVDDAFSRLLDFVSSHKEHVDVVRARLLEYFAMFEVSDDRVKRARMRLASLLY